MVTAHVPTAISAMTVKQRWLAAMRLEPVDRLPFWPKLDPAYRNRYALQFPGLSVPEIHDILGSDRHIGLPQGLCEVRRRSEVEVQHDDRRLTTTWRTPWGAVERVDQFDQASQAWHPVSFPAKTAQDIRLLTEVYADTSVDIDKDKMDEARALQAQWGESASTMVSIGESPFMFFVEWLAGIQNAHFLLADHPQEVEALFEAMHAVLVRKAALLGAVHPADMLYLIENTSTTLASPTQYRRYWTARIREYAEAAGAPERLFVLHMCGHLKLLLPDLAALPVNAFEAFTSPTVGNTRLLDGRQECPDKCLIGGTNATLWLQSTQDIIWQLEEDLAPLPHHRGLVLTSGGVMPPACTPETIREVGQWIARYPARMN